MRFLKLSIENFLVLTKAEISLDNRGLVLVQGINAADSSADSNGAGKSSIADALCWAIYGTTARGETGDAVVNNKAGKNTRVEVQVVDDMTTYRIVRHRKHKTGKNALHVFMNDGYGEKDLTKGTDKLTQEVVDRIIGASLEVFSGSIYAGQEKMPDLPSMTDKMLKMLIEEAAGITALEDAYRKARDNALSIKSDLQIAEGQLQQLQTQIQMREAQRDEAVRSDAEWTKTRDLEVAATDKHVREVLIPEIKRLIVEAPQSEIDNLTNEIATIDARIAAVAGELTQANQLAQNAATAASKSFMASNMLANSTNVLNAAEKALADVDHQVGCPCNECGRPLTEAELETTRKALETRVLKAAQDVATAQAAADAAERAARAAEAAHDAFKLSMTDVSAETAQRAKIEGLRAILISKDQQRQQAMKNAKEIAERNGVRRAEVSPFAAQIVAIQAAIDKDKQEVANQSGALAVIKERLAVEQEVVRVFSPAGVRARVLDEVTPYLNAQTSKYLSILSDGNINAEWSTLTLSKSGEMKERFAIDVSSSISSQTFKGLSGGEKRKVRVASALALQDLVATRASKPIDLFIGDEIDDALDASGLERLMIILEEKARERGTVMVISHNSLRDEIRNVLTVERDASGETTISESIS